MMDGSDALRKDLAPEEFQLFRDWIHHHSGIFLEDTKVDSLRISLVTRATRYGFTDYGDYFSLLESDEDEFKELMNLVTINETSFFRFPAQFEALRDQVIPEIMAGRRQGGPRGFRVWSAGCSTGEEPYTIGMTLLDSALVSAGYSCEVVGTDVSTQALERARAGVYPARSVATLQQQLIQRWFEPVKDGHRPIKPVRNLCGFHYHNLIKEPYPLAFMSSWDVIFCRNVTIYFRLESTRRVVQNFYDALNPGGYLFIGHSETLTSISDQFDAVEIGGVFLYRKPVSRHLLSFGDIMSRRSASKTAGGHRAARPAPPRPTSAAPSAAAGRETPTFQPSTPAPIEPVQVAQEVLAAPDSAQLVARAHALLEQAQATAALALARDAIELDPTNTEAHLVAAFAHADLGQLDDAMAQAELVLDSFPLTAGARYILGIIHQQRGDMDNALVEYKRTVYIDRDFVLAHFAIANIYRARGQNTDACREYENTLRALYAKPDGQWTAFLGGFRPDLLTKTCERSLIECGRGV